MKKKVIATVTAEIEVYTDWYDNKFVADVADAALKGSTINEYISEVEKGNLIEWFMENIVSTKVEVKDV